MKKSIIILLVINSLCYSKTFTDIDHSEYYPQLSLKEHINNTVTIKDIIEWFKTQSSKIEVVTQKENKYITVKYYFIERKNISTLTLYYNKEFCEILQLNMIINGTKKILYNNDVKKTLLMFLSYNNEFDYHKMD
jgi:hypothetical protein